MPIIDIRSSLSEYGRLLKKETTTYAEAATRDVDRLVSFLNSPKGAIFAAKQKALDPATAVQRLAGLFAQATLGVAPGVYIESVFASPKRMLEAEEEKRNSVEKKYYVKSPVDRQRYIDPEYDQLAELDIVPFYFTILETANGEVSPSYHLAFRSFFSTISDGASANYSGYSFIGRGENFHTYQTYARNANFSFKVAAFSKGELDILHDKVDNLRRLTAPKYRGGYMQGNYVNLTIGNYFNQMPGFLTSVSVNIADNFTWEIQDRTMVLPHVMDISVAYTVLESATPQLPLRELGRTNVPRKDINFTPTEQPLAFAPTFPPPAPQNFTADFSNRPSVGGVFLDDLFNSYE